MPFDVQAARASGYSDDEIADHLGQQSRFDVAGAKRAGYGTNEILDHLSGSGVPAARRELPNGVAPSKAGAGRGSVQPTPDAAQPAIETIYDPVTGMPLGTQDAQPVDGRTVDERRTRAPGRLTDSDIPAITAGSLGRDIASGALQIGPVALKGVGELARLATGDRVGKGLTDAMDRGIDSIQDVVGSERGAAQRKKFAQDMQDPALNAADVIFDNKGALADQLLPQVGSMFLPVAAASAAGKVATGSKAAKLAAAIDEATVLARANKVSEAAAIGTTVAQNAADTYSTIRDAGGEQDAAYLGAAITAPVTYVAGRLTGGGAEANAAKLLAGGKGAAKAIPKAMAKEGAQEMGEEVGQYTGETVGTGADFDANKAAKRMGVAGTLGAVMGGGVEGAGAAREHRIQALRDAGETATADQMQLKHDVESEISRLPGNAEFSQVYRDMRNAGVKPAEAAARSAVAVTFKGMAAGIPEKALSAAMDKAKGMPLDQVPGFLQKFAVGLANRGLVPPFEGMDQLGSQLEAARDDAMDTALGAVYQPVKPAMDSIQSLEQENALALVESGQTATNSIANDQTTQTARPAKGQAAPSQATGPVEGNAAATGDVSGARNAAIQAAGIDQAAHAAATSPLNDLAEPTQGQKEAGNYKVGRINLHGLNISIENPQGSERKGTSPDGSKWSNTLAAHYGYIRGTEGNDGDHVDTFVGPNPASQKVFVVDQVNKDGSFDEHKVVLGADNLQQADDLYHANYHAGWTGRGAITEMPIDQFKKWVKDGVKTKPLAEIAPPDVGAAPVDAADAVQPAAGGNAAAPANPVYFGRDNVAIGEGGRAFKTRKAADDARKLNTAMRVVRADGGYALTEKTAAQLTAQENAAKRLRNPMTSPAGEPIPAHAMIASAGGLAPDTRADMGMQGNVSVGNRKLFAGDGKGLTIERATELLVEDGYLPKGATHDQARDLIKRSLSRPQYNAEGTERMAAAELEARMAAAIAEIEEASDNQLSEIEDADIPWDAEVSSMSTEAAMQALGFTDQEISDAIANESRIQGQDSPDSGGPDAGSTTPAQADLGRRENPPREDSGSRGDTRRQETQVDAPQTPAAAGVSVSAFDASLRPDGTLAVKGEVAAIREILKSIPPESMTPMTGGVLVGKTQAVKALDIVGQEDSVNSNEKTKSVQSNSTDAIKSPGENQSPDAKPEALIELRKRESVLKALRKCLGS